MKLYIWRQNRKFHSWSMFNEPCVHQSMYTDVLAAVIAESKEQALQLLGDSDQGWLLAELDRITPTVLSVNNPTIAFSEVRCD